MVWRSCLNWFQELVVASATGLNMNTVEQFTETVSLELFRSKCGVSVVPRESFSVEKPATSRWSICDRSSMLTTKTDYRSASKPSFNWSERRWIADRLLQEEMKNERLRMRRFRMQWFRMRRFRDDFQWDDKQSVKSIWLSQTGNFANRSSLVGWRDLEVSN